MVVGSKIGNFREGRKKKPQVPAPDGRKINLPGRRFMPARVGSGHEKAALGKPRRRLKFAKGREDRGSRDPLLFELRKQFADFAVQVFAWLEFHDRTGRNFHFDFRFAGIPTDFRLRALDEEGPKIA